MKINEVEQAVGISKKNIRFYEQEGLLRPSRSANGYRDYAPADVKTLLQVKLLRKLDIPLEEIKRIQSGSLTLGDCLQRHLIVLRRRRTNLEATEEFCRRILSESAEMTTLPVEQLLADMENMEKGGTRFMDVRQRDKKTRKRASIVAAVIAIAFMVWFLGIMAYAFAAEPEAPVLLILFVVAFPLIGIVGTVLALRERLKEIEGGELDEASKY